MYVPKKPKKSARLVQWEDIVTRTQKSRMINAVMLEIAKLRKSPGLKYLWAWNDVVLVSDPDYGSDGRQFVVQKNGEIREYPTERAWYYIGAIIKDKELPELIEYYGITPQDISDIRKEIEA